MKKLPKLNLLAIAVVIFTIFVVFLALRGQLGTPDPIALNSNYWKEDGPFELSPERGRYALTYSLIENNTPFFNVDLARFVTPDLGYKNGHYVSLFAPGVSYLAAIGYKLGRYFDAAQVGSFATTAVFSIVNLLLIYLIVAKLKFGKTSGLLAGMVFLFATPAFAYAVNLYQHHVSTFLILLSLYLTIAWNNWWSLSIVWLLCAMSIPIDYPNLFLLLPIGLYNLPRIIYTEFHNGITIKIRPWRVLTFFSMAIPITFFLWFNKLSYGSAFQFSGTVSSVVNIDPTGSPVFSFSDKNNELEELQNPAVKKSAIAFFKARYLIEDLYIHLFSPDRGIVYFAPILVLGMIGAFFMYQKNAKIVMVMSAVALMDLLLYSMWGDPWGGWAFGSRYLIPAYAMLSIFLAAYLDHYRKNIIALVFFLLLAGYSVYVNTAGALSTSANPPQVQVLELEKLSGKRERYSFDRNLEYLQNGSSKSFVYQTWLKDKIAAYDYFRLIAGSITSVIAILALALYLRKESDA